MQRASNQPDHGCPFDDGDRRWRTLLASDCGSSLGVEIALVWRMTSARLLVTPQDVADATDHAAAAIEIVDSRIADWNIAFADTVADNGFIGLRWVAKRRSSLG